HEVETGLWERVLKLGGSIFGAWLALFGDGDAGDRVALEDGREARRLDTLHRREIQNVFGLFELTRAVYGTREGQKIEAVPLDERLGLPQGKYSYLLQDWDQHLAVEMPYATVSAALTRILGFTQSVHTPERNQRELVTAVGAFWEERPTPSGEEEGALLVCTGDGKGVPMRGGAKAPKAVEPPSTAGVRPGTKKMALIGAVYTVDPFVRTPDEVLDALFREAPVGLPPSRPRPCFKYVRAALERDDRDATEAQTRTIFDWMGAQVRQRNPDGDKPVVLVMDGQQSLWKAGGVHLPDALAEVTEILDLLHALGYLWEAAFLFHPNGSNAARTFVKDQARRMLHGDIAAVIRALRWLATHHKLKGKRRDALQRICGYFHNNAHRMAYDAYLEHGFPIASGVIEGACRCVVKDRMERSGMRWVMTGARAMLDLRCVYLSDLWEEFMRFRIQRESRRLYPGSAANDPDFSQPLAA
ncbi:MAG: ISKra4 family transposase, partial [Chromatiaceae bacterium]